MNQYQPDFNSYPVKLPFWKRSKRALWFFGILVIAYFGFYLASTGKTVRIESTILHPFSAFISDDKPIGTPDPNYAMPEKDDNRLNILILGIRGEDDPHADTGGPLLTDSIELFSYDKTTKKASLVSLPRDLYVKIHDQKMDKLNAAYEWGVSHSPSGLNFIKDKVSQISGVYVDKVVVIDFTSFKEIIDSLGGVDVTLTAPFSESEQWGYAFSLPAGLNHLNGQDALYYARSRYSSDDFDRARRQQQIMVAVKDKLLELNFFDDPVKTFSILNTVRNNIKTDISIWDTKQFINLAQEVNTDHIKKYTISTNNLVMEGRADKAYILLPKEGNFTAIKQLFQDILK